jgi:hypothetical protein
VEVAGPTVETSRTGAATARSLLSPPDQKIMAVDVTTGATFEAGLKAFSVH